MQNKLVSTLENPMFVYWKYISYITQSYWAAMGPLYKSPLLIYVLFFLWITSGLYIINYGTDMKTKQTKWYPYSEFWIVKQTKMMKHDYLFCYLNAEDRT